MPYVVSDITKAANTALSELSVQLDDKWNNYSYTKSIVAIIDVMGIKEWFSGEPDFKKHMKLYKTWDFVIESTKLQEVKVALAKNYGDFPLKYTILSDSIVISVSVDEPNAFSKLFMYYRRLVNDMFIEMNPPFMTRGAIVVGEIFQEGNIVFGPGLIKAHIMENNIANNFRHIVDKEDFNIFHEYSDELTDNILTGLFSLDDDGYYRFDYLKSYLVYVDNQLRSYPDTGKEKTGIAVLNKINKKIEDEIKYNADSRVVCKYEWMRHYFKQTMQHAIYQSDDDEYIWLKQANEKRKGGDRP